MSFEQSKTIDYAGVPVIRLAGVERFIPELALRQHRVVIPAIMKAIPALAGLQGVLSGGIQNMEDIAAMSRSFDEETTDLLLKAVKAALSRAYPNITLDDLLDLPITNVELVLAIPVLIKQSGLSAPEQKSGSESPQTGEAGAGSPQTMTSSSLTTASAPESLGPTI
jgi:hypothetical protein